MGFSTYSLPEVFQINDGYHSACYRKYTAYNANGIIIETTMTSVSTRSATTTTASKRTSVFEDLCTFCNKERKEIKGKWCTPGKCEQFETEINIKEAANTLNDNELKSKIGNYKFSEGPDFVALEVQYHHQCKRDYLNKARDYKRKTKNENSGTSIQRRKSDIMVAY